MIGHDELTAAVREQDARADDIGKLMTDLGLDEQALAHIGYERALRGIAYIAGKLDEFQKTGTVDLPDVLNTEQILDMATAGWLDGFTTGLRLGRSE